MSLILDGTTGCPVTTVTGTLPVANGGTGVTTSTGTGANVLSTSPTLVTPILGTPTSGNLANCTGIPAPAALSTASGSAPSYSARAWVNFNGTGTVAIRASGNVSSIPDGGVGIYTVNFTTAIADVNYAMSISSNNTSSNVSVSNDNDYASSRLVGSYKFAHIEAAGLADASVLCVAIFR